MNSLKIAWRKLFRKGNHSLTRIISLAAGLAFGLLLLSEVFYYYSFDSFYPDADRIYVVCENYKADNGSDKITARNRVSGAIAPGLKAEVPGIEAACRLNSIGPSIFYTDMETGHDQSLRAEFSFADENVFNVLPRPVLSGDPVQILKSPMACMVSDEIAEKIGGNVVGRIIELKEYPGKFLTIAGVFKRVPENTNYRYDVLISMVSTSKFMWDGTDNWLGNDRYYSCVRLADGIDPESLAPAVRKMQEVHQEIQRLESIQNGMVLKYSFKPLKKIHTEDVKEMIIILSAIAFAVIMVSLLNYILLTLSAMVGRAKNSAIYKTYGATDRDLHLMIFLETLLVLGISLFGAFMIISAAEPTIKTETGHNLSSALNPVVVGPLVIVLLIVLMIASYLPGRFFANVPVSSVFQSYHEKGKKWKLALLTFQFAGATFVLALLIIVMLQYDRLRNADHGYRSGNVYFGSTSGMPASKLPTVLNEIRSLPMVEKVGLGLCLPTEGASGNNILLPDDRKELFNVADFYWIDDNYLSILNIPIIEGESFSTETCVPNDFLISKRGSDMLLMNTGWKDGVTGKQINLTEHGTFTIRGVFTDFTIHSMTYPDQRPAMFSYLPEAKFQEMLEKKPSFSFYVLVKAQNGSSDIMKRLTDILNQALPHSDAMVKSLDNEKINLYASEKGFRTVMLAGNIIILLITLLGLLGYTVTEAMRRSKELALRRINGASLSDILKIFIKDMEYVAIPAVLTGLAGSWFAAQKWMENFSLKTPLHPWIFVLCGVFVLLFIATVSALNYIIIANRNPVEALRYE
ncbi:MAG TPA: FtsX-like permease family protein [Bacteroidales bacterium]|nr:FtsX-like permease family protein [Bacteroidales bacterium]